MLWCEYDGKGLKNVSVYFFFGREEAQAKLEALKQRGKQDLLIHSQEMRELQRKLDHDSKLHEFLGVKGQKRIMADLEAKEALRKRKKKNSSTLWYSLINLPD